MSIDRYLTIEGTHIDFKESLELEKPKSWLKSVSAFANTDGGFVIFGISDKTKEKIGLKDAESAGTKISELINAKIQPVAQYTLECEEESGKKFIVVNIEKGLTTPYYYVNEGTRTAYVRKGDQSIIAPVHELNNMILNGSSKTFDALQSQFFITKESFTLFEANCEIEDGEVIDRNKNLISFGLALPNGYLTNAGALLADKGLLRQSRVFCTRWKGLTKGSVEQDALDDKEYAGSLISLLQNAVMFITNNSHKGWTIKGLRREEIEEYPVAAVREAVVNALIHRDYQILGSEVHIDMYDDRLEVYSPGGMVNGWRIQDMNLSHVPSMRRNPVISDVFGRLHLMDRKGSGIGRILTAYKSETKKPAFYSEASSFFVTLPKVDITKINTTRTVTGNESEAKEQFVQYAQETLHKVARSKMIINTINMFNIYGLDIAWTRQDLEEVYKVKTNRAAQILTILKKMELVDRVKRGTYRFKIKNK